MSDGGASGIPSAAPLGRGGGSTSAAPVVLKFKLADHRYSREELLHFYDPQSIVPDGLAEMTDIFISECLQPVLLTPFTEEEQVTI